MGDYIAGPLLLARPTDQLPPGVLSVSECLAAIAPGSWAIDWVGAEDGERLSALSACGIPGSELPEVVAWATEHFGRGFAWPRVFLEAEVAREFHRRFLPDGFHLLQVGLPEKCLSEFLHLAAPPPQQPGYAPNGASGVYEALSMRQPLMGGEVRGFEVLGYERFAGGFESFRCFDGLLEEFRHLGATFNQWGLIDDEAVAVRCAELVAREGNTCADAWLPWLIVERTLQRGRTTTRCS